MSIKGLDMYEGRCVWGKISLISAFTQNWRKNNIILQYYCTRQILNDQQFSWENIIILLGNKQFTLPAQLTVTQGISSLLSLKQKTDVLINSILYCYNTTSLMSSRGCICRHALLPMFLFHSTHWVIYGLFHNF